MKRKRILELIEEGENLYCEFKLHFSTHEKIAKEIMAFANTKGGVILFGIDDSKDIVGVESEKGEAELIHEVVKNYCEPQVNFTLHFVNIENKEIVAVEIPESQSKPHRLQDYKIEIDVNTAIVPVRVNDKSIQASKEMIRLFKASINNTELKKYSIGGIEKKVFELLDENETIDVELLCAKANISERRSSRTLVKMVRAGLLLIHTKDNGKQFFTLAG